MSIADGNPVTNMSVKCDRCGAESNLESAFFKGAKSFSRKMLTYCPGCWAEKQHSESVRGLFLGLVPGAIGILFLVAGVNAEMAWFLVNLALFQLCMPLAILPHELAHAFVARGVGMKVLRIHLGTGATLFKFKFAGFDCEFKPYPTLGLVLAAHRTIKNLRARHFAFIAAGPAANAVLAIAGWLALERDGLWNIDALQDGFSPGLAFFYANLVVLLVNLLPRDAATTLGPVQTDGKQLFTVFFLSTEKIEAYHKAGYVMETSLLHQDGKSREALGRVEEGLALYPGDENLSSWRGVLELDLGNYADARECFLGLLQSTSLPATARPILLNNIAYADALLDRHDLLEEADSFSEEAMTSMGWVPAIRGTRGTVLVAMGRLEEGLPLLRDSMAKATIPAHKAQNACLIAEAESRLGNASAARDYLAEARKLDAGCLLLARTESVVQRNLNP